MLLFGIVGYVLQKGNFPVACLVLGMILGPLMEDNFHRALIISQNDLSIFVASPISITIWAVTLLAFAWGVLPVSELARNSRTRRGL